MLEDRDLREIRDIVSKEVYDALREQLPKLLNNLVTERELKSQIDALEDRIVNRLR